LDIDFFPSKTKISSNDETKKQEERNYIIYSIDYEMNFKTLALASALVFQTNDIAKHENVSLLQSEIYQALAENHGSPKDKRVYYTFDISQELLHQIDTMCLDLECPVVFTRSLEDVRNTPLFMK
jgi:hypothetical protein